MPGAPTNFMPVSWILTGRAHIPAGELPGNVSGQNEAIRNTQFGAQKVKDGIVDSIPGAGAPRPSVAPKDPDVTVSARLNRGRLSLGIDLSGHSLHMRGYRTEKGIRALERKPCSGFAAAGRVARDCR